MESEPFSLGRGVYERYVAMRWLRRRWWVVAVPVCAAAAASAALADVRWVLVGLMYIFIVTPGIISMAYFRYLLNPEARLTAIPKRVTLLPGNSIKIEYLPEDSPGKTEIIDWKDIRRASIWGDCYVLNLRPSRWPRFLLIPRRALPGPFPWDSIPIP